jgi:hypothetical protein
MAPGVTTRLKVLQLDIAERRAVDGRIRPTPPPQVEP